MKTSTLILLIFSLILAGCSDTYREIVDEKSGSKFNSNRSAEKFVPSHFQAVIDRLKDKNPDLEFKFQFVTEYNYLRVIDLEDDLEYAEVKYFADFTPEDYQELQNHYKNSKRAFFNQQQNLVGIITSYSSFEIRRFPVSTKIYTRVDQESEPLEGMNSFLDQVARQAKVEPYPGLDLPESFIFNAVVTPRGELVYCQLKNMIEYPEDQQLADKINQKVFVAFRNHSNQRGWKPGKVRGQRVYTQISVEVPTNRLL